VLSELPDAFQNINDMGVELYPVEVTNNLISSVCSPSDSPKVIEVEPLDSQRKLNDPVNADIICEAAHDTDEALLPNDRGIHDYQKLLGFLDIFQEMNDMVIKLNSIQINGRVRSDNTNTQLHELV
jgi:hypothetical protein